MIDNTINMFKAVGIIRDLLRHQSWARDVESPPGEYIGTECRYCMEEAICAGEVEHLPTCPADRGETLVREWDKHFTK